jgi:hypothetical protein
MTPGERIRERLKRVIHNRPVPSVRVAARDEAVGRVLRHPSGGGLPGTWPNDTFTRRRLRDGSIRIVGEAKAPPAKAADQPRTWRR